MSAVDTITMMGRDYVDENSKKLIDNTFQATRLVRTMREGARKWPGGPAVTEYIMYTGAGGGPHKPNKRFTNQDRQFGQQLRWVPKLMQVPVGISLTDLRVYNAPNPYRVLSMLETNISAAYVTLGALWETLLFLPGQGASWLYNMNGYAEICNDNSSISFDGSAYQMFGELDRTNAYWGKAIKGNVKNVNNEIGYSIMEQRYTKATVGGAEPTVIYTTPPVRATSRSSSNRSSVSRKRSNRRSASWAGASTAPSASSRVTAPARKFSTTTPFLNWSHMPPRTPPLHCPPIHSWRARTAARKRCGCSTPATSTSTSTSPRTASSVLAFRTSFPRPSTTCSSPAFGSRTSSPRPDRATWTR